MTRNRENAEAGDGGASRPPEPMLGGLSRLAGQGFADIGEAADEILRLVTTQFGMRTGFIADIDPDAHRFTVIAARNEPGGCGLETGTEADLRDTY